MRLLVADDDPEVLSLLEMALQQAGHVVDIARTGEDALWHASEVAYDAVILDVNLPPPDGIAITAQLRSEEVWTPILLLTGRAGTEDRVRGLDAGADDYLLKPFAIPELHARLRAITRRGAAARPPVLTSGDLEVDPAARRVRRQGVDILLSAREFALLELLVRSEGQAVTRAEILDKLWDFAFEAGSNVVDVTVKRLREKVDRPFGRDTIRTVRGTGYLYSQDS